MRNALTKAVGATAVTALVCAYIVRYVVNDNRTELIKQIYKIPSRRPIDF